jgi:hypothetical protein
VEGGLQGIVLDGFLARLSQDSKREHGQRAYQCADETREPECDLIHTFLPLRPLAAQGLLRSTLRR